LKKLVKGGITAVAAIGLVVGTATTASAASGWLDCQGRGRVVAIGTLTSTRGVVEARVPQYTSTHRGVLGESAIARSPQASGSWSVVAREGSASGWGNCD